MERNLQFLAMEIPRPSHHNGRGLRRDLSFERRLDSKDQEKNYKKCMDAYKACTSTDTVIQCYENIRVCQEK